MKRESTKMKSLVSNVRVHTAVRRSVGLLMLLVVSVAAVPAHADGTWRNLVSRWSNKCVDMRAQDGTGNGVLAQQWNCTGTQEQQFAPIFTGSGYFLLVNQRSSRCLRPSGGTSLDGALIEQWDCDANDPSQQWQSIDPGGNSTGAKWIINKNSGKCIEDSAWNTSNGVLLTQMPCIGGWKDYWFGL